MKSIYVLLMAMLFFSYQMVLADEFDDEEALAELYGDEETISLATGTAQSIAKAPAVATVFTAKDIEELGARDLDQILETVPGLHVSRRPRYGGPIYTFRGIYSEENPQVLVLINGIPITDGYVGDRGQIWGGMPVESIARIEVIRGPGSAIYGAEAFAGVINIITKSAEDIDGTEFGVRYGSFNTKDAWFLHGGNYAGFDFAFTAEITDTEGHSEDIDSDFQTLSDTLNGTNASLAPGSTNNGRENLDLRLDIRKGDWIFRSGLQRRRNQDATVGVAGALDPNVEYESDRWSTDLTYHSLEFIDNWDVTAQVSYFSLMQQQVEDQILYPAGAFLTAGPTLTPIAGPFPDGVIGNPEFRWNHYRAKLSGIYSGIDDHTLFLGTGYNHLKLRRVGESNNFLDPTNPPFFIATPPFSVTGFNDTPATSLPERGRYNTYGFIQDVWGFANDWELTAGLRYDRYNDFGDTWNPRLALVWSARHDTTLKLLYGEAFRAPSYVEFRNRNNPVATGNSELDPEEIETIELAADYRPMESLRLGLNVFHYKWDDIIDLVADGNLLTAQNVGRQEGRGVEFEVEWNPLRELSVNANYAFQDSEDKRSNEDAGNAPHHQIYARADWEFLPNWFITPAVNFIIDRDRPPGDSRDELEDYEVFDLTLRSKAFSDKWEFTAGVRNLFNSSPEEPTDVSLNISNDLPLERRSFFAGFSIKIQ